MFSQAIKIFEINGTKLRLFFWQMKNKSSPPLCSSYIVVAALLFWLCVGVTSTWAAVPTNISAGGLHTCALSGSGTVHCWGRGLGGALGNGGTSDSSIPVKVSNVSDAVGISSGSGHSCVVTGSGTVQCWGNNIGGQLGNGTTIDSAVPVTVSNITDAVAISAGDGHTCALSATGTIKCWGRNAYGQLGNGTTSDSLVPVTVNNITDAVAISPGVASGLHTCAITVTGIVKCWGYGLYGELGNGSRNNSSVPVIVSSITDAMAVSVGGFHTCAVTGVGAVKCWGAGVYGQLGNGSTNSWSVPVTVSSITDATAVSSGWAHTCAITLNGVVKCWGYGLNGELGNGINANSNAPITVSNISSVLSISAGIHHSCAITNTSTAFCWGNGTAGELGNGGTASSSVPVTVTPPMPTLVFDQYSYRVAETIGTANIGLMLDPGWALSTPAMTVDFTTRDVTAKAGADYSATNGTISFLTGETNKTIGVTIENRVGSQQGRRFQIELSNASGAGIASSVATIFIRPNPAVSAGHNICALSSSGIVQCWGNGGDLGDGTTTSSSLPVTVKDLNDAIYVSGKCALTEMGTVKCWGSNLHGELGNGTTGGSSPFGSPAVAVSNLTNVVAISHTCALLNDGIVKCWGFNGSGQLGDGSTTSSNIPVTVSNLTNAVAVSVSGAHSCAVRADGKVWCWGYNVSGQLGNGTRTNSLIPVSVIGISNAVAVSVGSSHSCALTADRTVFCWGDDYLGALGFDNQGEDALVPKIVQNAQDVVAISAGGYNTCTLTGAGQVYCWGDDHYGQLGNGRRSGYSYEYLPKEVGGLYGIVAISVGNERACALDHSDELRCWGMNTSATYTGVSPVPVTSIWGLPQGVPGSPSITAVNAVDNHASITISPPPDIGNSPVSGYIVTCSAGDNSFQTVSGLSSTLELSNLLFGPYYFCAARATNATGAGPSSSLATFIVRASQTITFGAAPSVIVGGTGTVSASGGVSGNAIIFTSTITPGVCTVSGNTVTGLAAGTCTIAADQAGNVSYNAATQVTQNIAVAKRSQNIGPITFAPSTLAKGGTTTASATATTGLAVSFSSLTPTACTVTGKIVTGVAEGTCTIAANQAGNASYTAAPQVAQNITVKLNQNIGPITFAPSTLAVGSTSTATATGGASGLPVIFSTTSPACTATGTNGRTITGIAAGACIITANQAGNATYNAAPLRAQTLAVGPPPVPVVSLNRTSLIFAARNIAKPSPAQAVTLTNTGAAVLNITGIVASGDFARTTTCGTTLAAGANCSISVTFTATAMGARTGAVTLTSNAAGSPHRIALTGTGKGTRYDFNGDGKSDILWRNTTTGANQIWFMNGGIKTSFANTTAQATGWTIAGVNDFNADGKADILWSTAAGQTAMWLMNGATRISSTAVSPVMAAPWTIAGTGDFNGDGKADILWRNTTTGVNQIWFMNGGIKTSAINTTVAAITLEVAGVNDFNADGKADILWRNATIGQNSIWFMNGATMSGGGLVTGTIAAPWTIAGTGDFNGDGKADLMWRNTTTGADTMWFMNVIAATGATTLTQLTNWSVSGISDFNGDGKADITWRSPATGATQLWLMNGAIRSSTANLTPVMLAPWAVAK